MSYSEPHSGDFPGGTVQAPSASVGDASSCSCRIESIVENQQTFIQSLLETLKRLSEGDHRFTSEINSLAERYEESLKTIPINSATNNNNMSNKNNNKTSTNEIEINDIKRDIKNLKIYIGKVENQKPLATTSRNTINMQEKFQKLKRKHKIEMKKMEEQLFESRVTIDALSARYGQHSQEITRIDALLQSLSMALTALRADLTSGGTETIGSILKKLRFDVETIKTTITVMPAGKASPKQQDLEQLSDKINKLQKQILQFPELQVRVDSQKRDLDIMKNAFKKMYPTVGFESEVHINDQDAAEILIQINELKENMKNNKKETNEEITSLKKEVKKISSKDTNNKISKNYVERDVKLISDSDSDDDNYKQKKNPKDDFTNSQIINALQEEVITLKSTIDSNNEKTSISLLKTNEKVKSLKKKLSKVHIDPSAESEVTDSSSCADLLAPFNEKVSKLVNRIEEIEKKVNDSSNNRGSFRNLRSNLNEKDYKINKNDNKNNNKSKNNSGNDSIITNESNNNSSSVNSIDAIAGNQSILIQQHNVIKEYIVTLKNRIQRLESASASLSGNQTQDKNKEEKKKLNNNEEELEKQFDATNRDIDFKEIHIKDISEGGDTTLDSVQKQIDLIKYSQNLLINNYNTIKNFLSSMKEEIGDTSARINVIEQNEGNKYASNNNNIVNSDVNTNENIFESRFSNIESSIKQILAKQEKGSLSTSNSNGTNNSNNNNTSNINEEIINSKFQKVADKIKKLKKKVTELSQQQKGADQINPPSILCEGSNDKQTDQQNQQKITQMSSLLTQLVQQHNLIRQHLKCLQDEVNSINVKFEKIEISDDFFYKLNGLSLKVEEIEAELKKKKETNNSGSSSPSSSPSKRSPEINDQIEELERKVSLIEQEIRRLKAPSLSGTNSIQVINTSSRDSQRTYDRKLDDLSEKVRQLEESNKHYRCIKYELKKLKEKNENM